MTQTDKSDGGTMPKWRSDPDPHGQAALLLAESTLHLLVESGVLTAAQALDAVRTAAVVKKEVAEEEGESAAVLQESLMLLLRIERSFESRAAA